MRISDFRNVGCKPPRGSRHVFPICTTVPAWSSQLSDYFTQWIIALGVTETQD